jgi:hypothetical protein
MTKFILHGGKESESNYSNESYFKEIADSGKVFLMCYFAREPEEVEENRTSDIRRITRYNPNARFVLASEVSMLDEIKNADVIFFKGGNTDKLMQTLLSTGLDRAHIVSKTVAGSSAGAYICSNKYMSSTKLKVFNGLAFLNANITCHFREESTHLVRELLDQEGFETICLRDYEWVVRREF